MSILRVVTLLAGVVVLVAVGIAAYLWQSSSIAPDIQPTLVLASPAPQPDFSALLVADTDGTRRVVVCTKARCTPQPRPEAHDGQAVFDGEGWLYYTEAESALTKLTKRILVRTVKATGATQQLIEQTPLTSPRDLYASPTGEHTAFFLDNIDRPDDELTELWVYDRAKHGVRLLAEKLYQPDIRSRLRWNRAGTLLWFLADTAPQDSDDVLEVVVVPLTSSPAAPFKRIAWDRLTEIVDEGVMDIAPSGEIMAYAAPRLFGRNDIVVATKEQASQTFSVRGEVTYLQILEDHSIIYGVQDPRGVTFWRYSGSVQRHIARQPGRLLSAQGVASGEFIALVTKREDNTQTNLHLLHTPTGSISAPTAGGVTGTVHLAQVVINPPAPSAVAGSSAAFDDAEIAAFIDQHFSSIIGVPSAKARRMLMTDRANNVFVDYTSRSGTEERILVAITDLSHADWAIKARYRIAQAEWQKIQGGGLPDPKPTRLYEWEESVGQWILKTAY